VTADILTQLRQLAVDRDDDLGDLLSTAADRIATQDDRIAELQTELEETNEGMVALTLELQEAEQRYRSLFENAVEGIYKTTPDGRRYVLANESMAEILGYDAPEALQEAVTDIGEDVFLDPDRYETYQSRLRDAGAIENFEYQVQRADGEVRWVRDNARTLSDDGSPSGFRGGVIDVTELRTYETRLERTNEELEALNRLVRHDISNDVQVIQAFAERLDERLVEDGEREAIEKILSATDHITDLTENAREYIEAVTGDDDPELEPVDLCQVLAYELDRQRDANPHARFELLTDLPAVAVRANEMLGSIFRNLLGNAVEHNDSDPVVEIVCIVHADSIEIHVADDGPGIPPDRRDAIFGKGEQSLDSEGTGIGLYLVDQLVSLYDGEIHVEDRAEWSPVDPQTGEPVETTVEADSGSVFVLRLARA